MDPFVTTTDLGTYLGRDLSDDERAVIALHAASDIVRSEAGQDLTEAADDIVVLDGTGTDALLLPQLPVTAVSLVTIDDTPFTDYTLANNGVLFCTAGSYWTKGRQNIAVTYDHGFTTAEFPRDLRMVALNLAARVYDQQIVSQESVGAYSVTFAVADAIGLSDNERRIVHKYRRV